LVYEDCANSWVLFVNGDHHNELHHVQDLEAHCRNCVMQTYSLQHMKRIVLIHSILTTQSSPFLHGN